MSRNVSILIPAYNAEKWIAQTIESAVSQTWPDKEIIIVDDGCRDRTFRIAKKYESKGVKIVSQENQGASAARNTALQNAQGDFIQWLDADDLLAPNKIEEQMKYADEGPSSLKLLSGPYGIFYWRIQKAKFTSSPLWRDLTPLEYFMEKFTKGVWMNPAGWLVSRRITEKAGKWDERIFLDNDGEYFCRAVAASEGIIFVKEARCYYRHSGYDQLSRGISEKARKSALLSLASSVRCLLSLEDSERTRMASLMAVRRRSHLFYPDRHEELRELERFARELGGELETPDLGWKLEVMRKIIGLKKAKAILFLIRKMKLTARVKWDESLYKLGKQQSGMAKQSAFAETSDYRNPNK